eukprot:14529330-Alexandrium_andersonii.AAC.1
MRRVFWAGGHHWRCSHCSTESALLDWGWKMPWRLFPSRAAWWRRGLLKATSSLPHSWKHTGVGVPGF